MNAIVKILKRAREKVAKGWIQHRGMSPDGEKVCAVMAINMAFTELANAGQINPTRDANGYRTPEMPEAAGEQLMSAINERFPLDKQFTWGSVPFWNDVPGRTQDEVLDTFDHAIKAAEAALPEDLGYDPALGY